MSSSSQHHDYGSARATKNDTIKSNYNHQPETHSREGDSHEELDLTKSGIFNRPLLIKHNASLQSDAESRGWKAPSHSHSHKKTWQEKYPKLEHTILGVSVVGLAGFLIYGWTLLGQGSGDTSKDGNTTTGIRNEDKIATFTFFRKSQNGENGNHTIKSTSGNGTEEYYNRTISLGDAITEIPTILTKLNSNLEGEGDETETEMLIEIYGNSIRLSDLEKIIKDSSLNTAKSASDTKVGGSADNERELGGGKRVPKIFIA